MKFVEIWHDHSFAGILRTSIFLGITIYYYHHIMNNPTGAWWLILRNDIPSGCNELNGDNAMSWCQFWKSLRMWQALQFLIVRDCSWQELDPLPFAASLGRGLRGMAKRQGHNKKNMDQYLLIPFLVGWTSIYQLFWSSLGTRVLTHPHMI